MATIGAAVRYPDVLVTCTDGSEAERLIPDPVIVFEVISPSSGRVDRHVKVREYAAVSTIRRYVLVEATSPDVTVFVRQAADADWTVIELTAGETLSLAEIAVELPVDLIFARMSFSESGEAG